MRKKLRKILSIDDDEDIHSVIEIGLQSIAGLEVRSALSGMEGLEEAKEFHPDLILLDATMPGMDGIETVQALKLLPELMDIPVVFLTAKIQKKEVEEYFKYGAKAVIVKPFDPIVISEEIMKIWEEGSDVSD